MAKILVVDDDLSIRLILEEILEDYDVTLARDGLEAIALTDVHKPDLILMDIVMPNINGIETAKAISLTSSVPIIFVSAASDEERIPEGLTVFPVIAKPFDPTEIVDSVECALRSLSFLRAKNVAELVAKPAVGS